MSIFASSPSERRPPDVDVADAASGLAGWSAGELARFEKGLERGIVRAGGGWWWAREMERR
jgi:hypothetical protein